MLLIRAQIDELISKACKKIADRRWPTATFYRAFFREAITSLYEAGKRKFLLEYR